MRNIPSARGASVTMVSTLATFSTALLMQRLSGQGVGLDILAVVLSLSLARVPGHQGWRRAGLTVVMVPLIGIGAVSLGQLLQQHFVVGAVVLTTAISASFFLRQFPWGLAQAGRLLLLPVTSILVVPAIGFTGGSSGRWWDALVALVALAWVTLITRIAMWIGLVSSPPVVPVRSANAPWRRSGQTRMALQLGVSLTVAMVIGRSFFPNHWNWTVLTAIIVCGSGPSRGEVAVKGVTRLIGASFGTLTASAVASELPGHHDSTVIVIFAILFVGSWWRETYYAVWAGGATCVMALLTSYFGTFGSSVLGTRLLAILIGAACSIVVCSVVYPISTGQMVRRRRGNALAALQDLIRSLTGSKAELQIARHHFEQHISELRQAVRPLRWQQITLGAVLPPNAALLATTSAVLGCVEPTVTAITAAQGNAGDPRLADSATVVVNHITHVRRRLAGRAESSAFTPIVVNGSLAQLNEAVLAIP
jgi:hypothetical protein